MNRAHVFDKSRKDHGVAEAGRLLLERHTQWAVTGEQESRGGEFVAQYTERFEEQRVALFSG